MQISLVDVNNIQNIDFKLHRENGSSDYLFVLFKSPSKILVCDEYVDADWGAFTIFDKHKIQSYYPCNNKEFIHDYMHFDLENDYEETLFLKFLRVNCSIFLCLIPFQAYYWK